MKKEKGILSDFDILDVNNVIISIEKSFNISFEEDDFEKIKTYGQFEYCILSKINGTETNDCTSQQAFYKLRKILAEEFNIPFDSIKPKSQLKDIFPLNNRIKKVFLLKNRLSTEVNFLKPDFTMSSISTISILLSLYYFFSQFFFGLFLFVIGIFCLQIAKDFGKEFYSINVGELSKSLIKKDYQNARRNPKTYNPKEVRQIIKDIFSEVLNIEKSKIQYDTIL